MYNPGILWLSTPTPKNCGKNPSKRLEEIIQKSLFCIVIQSATSGIQVHVSLKENYDIIKAWYPAAPENEYTALLIEEAMKLYPDKMLLRIDFTNFDKLLILE
ncbi:MAG: hypothetical protein MUE33_09965 [Cytophagaceae bacterium]|jgi:hypothetical protein|nr:hypothetical protein [Cytophagaceae bacterium]